MKEPGHFVVRKFSSQVRSPGVLVPMNTFIRPKTETDRQADRYIQMKT